MPRRVATAKTNPAASRKSRIACLGLLFVVSAAFASCSSTEEAAPSTDLALSSEPDDVITGSDDANESELAEESVGGVEPPTSTTPTTEGSGLPPVVTSRVPQGGDPGRIYRGVIGALDPNEAVANVTGKPPTGSSEVQPLTGYAAPVEDRPAVVVKIDNGPGATPHVGLNSADIVVEEEVEGGVTRLAAIFQSTSSIVGPVRSGRTTDIGIIGGLGEESILLYSGANEITQKILADQDFLDLRSEGWSTGFWRDNNRRAPSNLFTDTAPHWASTSSSAPAQQFHYRSAGSGVSGVDVVQFSVSYPASKAIWEWDGDAWLRSQRGAQHLLANGEQASAANVVVVEADEVATGMVDSSGGAVPEFVFVGTGRAVIFTEGKRIEGIWTRPTLTSVATFTDNTGESIELTPGRTWMQLVSSIGAVR